MEPSTVGHGGEVKMEHGGRLKYDGRAGVGVEFGRQEKLGMVLFYPLSPIITCHLAATSPSDVSLIVAM